MIKLPAGRGVIPLCMLLVLGACEDDDPTPPETGFDPAFATEAATGIAAVLEPGGLDDRLGLATFVLAQASTAGELQDYMGRTLVYDGQDRRYEIDPNRLGAPEDGIRFITYEMDANANSPRFPLREVGYLDVRIAEQGGTTTVGVTSVSETGGESVVTAEVISTVTSTDDAAGSELVFAGAGYVREGDERVEFDVSRTFTFPTGSDVGSYDQSVMLEVEDGPTFEQTLTADFDVDTFISVGDAAYVATITSGGETLTLDLVVDEEDAIEGEVEHDQEVVLEVVGPFLSPEFRLPDGAAAPAATRAAMAALWEDVRVLEGLALRLLGPVDAVSDV